MAKLEATGIKKCFDGSEVLKNVSITAEDGEFVALLGPSGCGKSTLLGIISGITACEGGSVRLGGRDITALPAEKRGIGMVFQNYALFPHMNVRDNIAYSLKLRREKRAVIDEKVAAVLKLVRLEGFDGRAVTQLSGGEQQRVALARAIVMDPQLLLLDEPLSALDKKIREQMQYEIKRIQRETGITTLFVTHDQSEALALADRIAVMSAGEISETGRPADIYLRPSSMFAATFLGTSNLLRGKYDKAAGKFCSLDISFDIGQRDFDDGQALAAVIKEEHIELSRTAGAASGTVSEKLFLGQTCALRIAVGGLTLRCVMMARDAEGISASDAVYLNIAEYAVFAEEEQ